MSEVANLLIAYCIDNEQLVLDISQHIKKTDISFQLSPCDATGFQHGLLDALDKQDSKVMIIITDNFLKSKKCMYQALNALIRLDTQQQLIPIIADGVGVNPHTNKLDIVPTYIEKVSNVIQYMNYWQDYFFELKEQKKHIDSTQLATYESELKVVRSISAEVGEFLKYLRTAQHYYYKNLSENHFKNFYELLGKTEYYSPTNDSISQPLAEETKTEVPVTNLQQYFDEDYADDEAFEEDLIDEDALMLSKDLENDFEEDLENQIIDNEYEDDLRIQAANFDSDDDEEDVQEDEETIIYYPKKAEVNDLPELTINLEKEKAILNNVEELVINNDTENALHALLDGLIVLPASIKLRYLYAKLLTYEKKNFDAAEWQLKLLLSYHPDFAPAYETLGYINEQLGNNERTLHYYEKFASYDPELQSSEFYTKLANLSQKQENIVFDKIANYLRIAIQKDPHNYEALYQYALLLNEQKHEPFKAIDYLKKTLLVKPNHPKANFDLAQIYYELGYRRKAAYYYDRATIINPILKTADNDKQFRIHPEEPIVAEAPTPENTNAIKTVVKENTITPSSTDTQLTVLISGATSGIGKATAALFAQHGHRIIITGRSESKLQKVRQAIFEATDNDVQILPFDVRYFSASKNAIEALPDDWKQIDVLINNAGLAKGLAPIHEGNIEHWDLMIDTNIKGL